MSRLALACMLLAACGEIGASVKGKGIEAELHLIHIKLGVHAPSLSFWMAHPTPSPMPSPSPSPTSTPCPADYRQRLLVK